jgi:hypothetical protein
MKEEVDFLTKESTAIDEFMMGRASIPSIRGFQNTQTRIPAGNSLEHQDCGTAWPCQGRLMHHTSRSYQDEERETCQVHLELFFQ